MIIIHNNQNNDNDDDNGGGETIHTKYQDIDLFTHDMKNKTIFLEINTFTNGTLIGKERFYKLSWEKVWEGAGGRDEGWEI